MIDRSRFVGCLLGGAVGDALGAPFEGLWGATIPERDELLAGFGEFEGYPTGQYTDDTQLTLATVEAVLEVGGIDCEAIASSIARLWANDSVIGPGGACTRAAHTFLSEGNWRTCGAPVGQAGNGTSMRIAPVGLAVAQGSGDLPAVAADVSRITHTDPRSVAGGGAIAQAVQLALSASELSAASSAPRIRQAMAPYSAEFADLVGELPALLELEEREALLRITSAGQPQPEFEEPIITPFVVPTVLACLFAVFKYPSSWEDSVAYVIRLGGDVDTTGCIVGAIMGARLGRDSIPQHLAQAVVDSERIQVLAGRLHALTNRA